MVLSKRERYVAIAVVAAVGILILDHFLFSPYFDRRKAIVEEQDRVQAAQDQANDLFDRQRRLRPVWAEMQKGGLKANPSEAESQALNALLDWAQDAHVELTSIKPERSTPEKWFQIVSFRATGTGQLAAVARLLWSVETATIPVRLNEVTIKSRKEGTNDLAVELSLSTVSLLPDADRTGKTTLTMAGERGQLP